MEAMRHIDNLQLLYNSMKGTGAQEKLVAKLTAEGIRTPSPQGVGE